MDINTNSESKDKIPKLTFSSLQIELGSAQRESNPEEKISELRASVIGAILIVVSSGLMVLYNYMYKHVGKAYKMNAHELLFHRGLHGIYFCFIGALIFKNKFFAYTRSEATLIILRASIFTLAGLFQYTALLELEVSLVNVLHCIMPMLVGVLGLIFLKEDFFYSDIGCSVAGMLGLAMVVKQPEAIFGKDEEHSGMYYVYVVLVLCAISCFAVVNVITRVMKGALPYMIVNFYNELLRLVVEFLILYFFEIECSISVGKFFAVHGVHTINFGSLTAFYYAHKYILAVSGSFLFFINSVFAVIIDYGIIQIGMDTYIIIGFCILMVSGFFLTVIKVLRERKKLTAVSNSNQFR